MVSLRDGRSTVTVTPSERRRDKWGVAQRVPLEPVTIPATVKFQKAAENADIGVQPNTGVKVIAPQWPGREQDRFTWNGMVFEQVGPAKHLTGTAASTHYEVLARLIAYEDDA